MLHGKFKSQYTLSLSSSFLLLLCPSLEKGETPRYHGSKISESQQSFLIQPDGHFHFRTTDKKPMSCRSVLDHECNHSPKIHTYHFFSCHVWRTKVCCDLKVLLPWQRDVTTVLSISNGTLYFLFVLLVSFPLMYDLVWNSGRLTGCEGFAVNMSLPWVLLLLTNPFQVRTCVRTCF